MDEYFLQRNKVTSFLRLGFGNFTKGALAQFADPVVFLYFGASLKSWLAVWVGFERVTTARLSSHFEDRIVCSLKAVFSMRNEQSRCFDVFGREDAGLNPVVQYHRRI